jgi:geranyl-CoA carboxylase beta subunit
VSGLGEYLAEDDRHALGIAREVVARLASAPTPALPRKGREQGRASRR